MPLPSLVLLPGLDGTGLLFRPLLEALPDDVSTVVLSYPEDVPLGYAELLPAVEAALPSGGPFVLLGESFSGPLAVMAAATRPPGLVGLALSATFIRSPHPYLPALLARAAPPALFRCFAPLSRLKTLLTGNTTPALRALVHDAVSRVAPAVLKRRLREVLSVDVSARLSTCPVPLLYLRGRNDLVVPSWSVTAVRRVQPEVEVVVLPTSHLVLQVAASAAASELTRFLATCGEAHSE